MDAQLLDQTIQFLKPIAAAGSAIGSKVAASALWDWIKSKFQTRSAAAAEAVTDLQKAPQNEVNWQVFQAQLAKAIAEDKDFCEELKQRLAQMPPQSHPTANIIGDQNKTIQITGSGNTASIQ